VRNARALTIAGMVVCFPPRRRPIDALIADPMQPALADVIVE
jgi:hypothetical protein